MLNPDAHLTTDGVVITHVHGALVYMHPYCFRDLMGEEAYQELLTRPRVPSPYPELEFGNDSDAWGV